MSDFKYRLSIEKSELAEKISKLSVFVSGNAIKSIDPKQAELLNKQLLIMQEYCDILTERIELLN